LGSSPLALGLAPSPISTVSAVLSIGLAPGGLPRPEDPSGIVTEGLWDSVLRPLSVMSYKPMQRYSRKLRGNRFLRMDDSLIVEAVSSFCTPFGFSGAGKDLVVSPFGLGFDGLDGGVA
jgi:hypothetical protein